jgi:hypothetical protein
MTKLAGRLETSSKFNQQSSWRKTKIVPFLQGYNHGIRRKAGLSLWNIQLIVLKIGFKT